MINIEKNDNIVVITFSVNNINALISDEIRDRILTIINNQNTKIIIDLKGIDYIDSSGFGCFLSLMRASKSNYGILKFANPEPRVMQLFETLRLDTVFQIFDDIDVCRRSFK
jgi:anti-anti-sigma factor